MGREHTGDELCLTTYGVDAPSLCSTGRAGRLWVVFIKALFGYSYVCHFPKKKKKKSFLYSLLWQGLISSVMYSSHLIVFALLTCTMWCCSMVKMDLMVKITLMSKTLILLTQTENLDLSLIRTYIYSETAASVPCFFYTLSNDRWNVHVIHVNNTLTNCEMRSLLFLFSSKCRTYEYHSHACTLNIYQQSVAKLRWAQRLEKLGKQADWNVKKICEPAPLQVKDWTILCGF